MRSIAKRLSIGLLLLSGSTWATVPCRSPWLPIPITRRCPRWEIN